jgi:hypothetical protein
MRSPTSFNCSGSKLGAQPHQLRGGQFPDVDTHLAGMRASARVTTSAWSRLTAPRRDTVTHDGGAASTRLATLTQRCAERMEMRCRLRYHTAADDAASAEADFTFSIWRIQQKRHCLDLEAKRVRLVERGHQLVAGHRPRATLRQSQQPILPHASKPTTRVRHLSLRIRSDRL